MEEKNNQIKVNFENVEHSLYLIDYIRRKIRTPKFSRLNLTPHGVNIKKDHTKGAEKYTLSVTITINKVQLFFKEVGDNLYALIDAIVRKINQKLSKLRSNRNFQNKTSLKYML